MLDRFVGVTIEFVFRGNALFSGIFSVVLLVVEWGDEALVVRRHDARSEHGAVLVAWAAVHLCDRVGLHKVLRGITHVLNHAGIVVQRRVGILGSAREPELVTERGLSGSHV